MKVYAMKQRFSNNGLRVMECLWVNVPLKKIIDKQLGSAARLEMPGIAWNLRPVGYMNNTWAYPQKISFTGHDDQTIGLEGIIWFRSLTSLVDFISERINPAGQGPLSEIVRAARHSSGEIDKLLIEEQVQVYGTTMRHQFCPERANLPLVQSDWNSDYDLVSVHLMKQDYWIWSAGQNRISEVLLAAEHTQQINGHKIPRLHFIKPLHGLCPTPHEITDNSFFIFDGERHACYRNLEDVSKSLLDDLDKHGAMYYACDFDILYMDHLEVVALIKLPSRKQAKKLTRRAIELGVAIL